jgi:ferredoxin-NADP reductase
MLLRAHIIDVERATPRSVLLCLGLDAPFEYEPGQAVLVGSASSEARRPYSIANGPRRSARDRRLELLVGLGEDGAPGPHLPVIDAGIPLTLEGPFGSFVCPPAIRDEAVLFVAGGTGIAPLRAMLQELLDEGAAAPRLKLLYSARAPEEFAFDVELRALAGEGRQRYHRTARRAPAGTATAAASAARSSSRWSTGPRRCASSAGRPRSSTKCRACCARSASPPSAYASRNGPPPDRPAGDSPSLDQSAIRGPSRCSRRRRRGSRR